MIDLIKTLVQTLVQVIPQIRGTRTDKKRRQLGATLFILYVRLNETMLTADDIINSLEEYVAYVRRQLSRGNDPYDITDGRWIKDKVQRQITNFERLHGLLYDSRISLQIIDAESYNRLMPLLDRKVGALRMLLEIMWSGSLPLLPTADELGELMKLGGDQDVIWYAIEDLLPRWNENTLSTTETWGEEIYQKIVAYLQERRPREQLAEIHASLSSLRKALDGNFSVADILLEVGDRRMDTPY